MKKTLVVTLATVAAAAVAVPAFAKDHSISGFYRARAMAFNHPASDTNALQKDQKPSTLLDQRFRARWDMKLNEFVSVTYFGEIDFSFGDAAYGTARNAGGGLGGDQVNLETKNLFADVKIPNTPVSARVGLQGFADNWSFSLFAADMAGVSLRAKHQMFDSTLGWFKWNEGNVTKEDDRDLWAAQVAFKPMGGLKLGTDLYWVDDKSGSQKAAPPTYDADRYYLGLNAGYKVATVDVSGWAAYAFGTEDKSATTEYDIGGLAASVKGAFSVAGAKGAVRLSYFSSDDDATDNDIEYFKVPVQGEAFSFPDTNLLIMLSDARLCTRGALNGGLAMDRAAYEGWGLFALNFTADYVPPMAKDAYVNFGLGYFQALEDSMTVAGGTSKKEGKTLGTEVALRAGYKFGGVADVSLNGAYVSLGDFFEKSAAGSKDPDNLYQVYAMLNIGF